MLDFNLALVCLIAPISIAERKKELHRSFFSNEEYDIRRITTHGNAPHLQNSS